MCALSGELTIDLSAIQKNYDHIDEMTGTHCLTAASVKADCYGLGAAHVVPALYQSGVRQFFVATLNEGIEIRGMCPDVEIFILNGFMKLAHDVYREYNLTPVLNSLAEIDAYDGAAIIHFDTGMNRLGLGADEAEILCNDLSRLSGIDLQYIMSHFSSSDEKDSPVNHQQYQRFLKIRQNFKNVKASLSNSGGVFLSRDYHMDLTRPGIALYGGNPVWGQENVMQPVISLSAPVLQIRKVKKGERAGYNGIYSFKSDGHVAVISAGYADGILRSAERAGALYWQGHKMPIRGRVSMDLVICDLCDVPEKEYPKSGDMVEVIGADQTLDHFAAQTRTISYEILTSLGNRYKRIYRK